MNLKDALLALSQGKRLHLKSWDANEFIFLKGDNIVDESAVIQERILTDDDYELYSPPTTVKIEDNRVLLNVSIVEAAIVYSLLASASTPSSLSQDLYDKIDDVFGDDNRPPKLFDVETVNYTKFKNFLNEFLTTKGYDCVP